MQHAILLLPASAAAPGPAMLPAKETGADGRIAAPVRVLLVEDEILTALDIEYLVQQLGYEVCGIAASAPEAVQAADDLRPDLVRTWSETPAEFHLQPISVFRPCGGLAR
jgi:PleD family two-component response regulator